ncbi:hypothetical protein GLOIN_2v1790075 [Rhizophagus irregularis DAOM 181602=DAOM 197198]|nr:hypothetical protein GLOIN_2v1790075 [Rhizophagus irregularis DAOM 181602=DAOM 197198]
MVIIYFALYDKCGLGKPSKWYIDLAAQVTIHNSDSVLKHEFHPTNFTSFSNTTSLSPCDQFDVSKRCWIVSINDSFPIFGKQLAIQPKRQTCVVSHWLMDVSLSPDTPICLLRCGGLLYASSKSWDKFATRAYTLYSDMGDDTESECSSADEELFTSTSSSNTITTPNLVLEMPDQTGKNLPIPEATQILTGYKEADDQQEQVRDIIVYDIPYTWDVEKILGELTLWGHTIKLSFQAVIHDIPEDMMMATFWNDCKPQLFLQTCGASAFKIIQTSQGKRKLVGYFENWETTLKALDTPQVFLNDKAKFEYCSTPASLAEQVYANTILTHPVDAHYVFYTDGSLIHLGTPEVSIGWSWVQIHDLHLNSVATYAHGTVKHWPSSSHAEAAAIYAALSSVPNGAKV